MNDNPICSSDLDNLCNDYVTNYCNANGIFPTRSQFQFIKRALEMNVIAKEYWCYLDFTMSQVNFRQMIHRIKKIIIKERNTRQAFYRLNGITVPGTVTKGYRGVDSKKISPDFEKILLNLKYQPPQMHDLRIQTFTNLYDKLYHRGMLPNKQNNAFTIEIPIKSRFTTKVNVYKNKMQIMLGCSQRPIQYAVYGFQELIFHLGQVVQYLVTYAHSYFEIQPVSDWIVTCYHFNRDGIIIQSPIFNYTIENLENHSLVYMKHFEDGTVRPRYEELRTPQKPLSELVEEAANEAFCS